jgi:hypothetical protein
LDANDLIYPLEASADYDPAPDLRKVRAGILSINFADDYKQLSTVSSAGPGKEITSGS